MGNQILSNRFSELLAVKARREGRRITNRQVVRETGLLRHTVDSYAKNAVTRYDSHIVLTLCRYLDCTPADFFVVEQVEEDPEWRTPQPA